MSGVWDPCRPELDSTHDGAEPAVNYIVCSTPRTGSGLLCRGLASTGRGGAPAEYFNGNQRGPLSERWATGPDLRAYAAALLAHRTSAIGVFGVKLHWNQLERLVAELRDQLVTEPGFDLPASLLSELIPEPRFIRVLRLDIDRQAISLWNALHRRVWSVRAGTTAPGTDAPVYDREQIERIRQSLITGEIHWDRFFRRNGITPIEVYYEDLVGRYGDTIARVVRELVGHEVAPDGVPAPDSLPHAYPETDATYAAFVGQDRVPTSYDLAG